MAKYGTVATMRLKPGHLDDFMALWEEWKRDHQPRVPGAIGGYAYKLDADPNTIIMCAIFESKDAYVANADNPEQDKWFRRMMEHFDGEPEWNDGEIIAD